MAERVRQELTDSQRMAHIRRPLQLSWSRATANEQQGLLPSFGGVLPNHSTQRLCMQAFLLVLLCRGVTVVLKSAPLAATLTTLSLKENHPIHPVPVTTKHILYYNAYWGIEDFEFGRGQQPFLEYDCPVYNCTATSIVDIPENKSLYATYDAFLVSIQQPDGFDIQKLRPSIESWRKPHHRFVFMIMEAPYYDIIHFDQLNGFFNWTMTYKWNSDFPRPYGWFARKPSESFDYLPISSPRPYAEPPPETWVPFRIEGVRKRMQEDPAFAALAKRPKKVAWIVKKCHPRSHREEYVRELSRYIHVEIFGGHCGEGPKCDMGYTIKELDSCTKQVQEEFKFYLAFENSFCNDYATEKFFHRMESSVVVTLGQANYSKLAPPHSQINIFDFESPKDLANYLHELDQDDEQYLSYFWWQEYYQVRHTFSGTPQNNHGQAMCQLCAKLHNPSEPPSVYDDLGEWWTGSAECDRDNARLERNLA